MRTVFPLLLTGLLLTGCGRSCNILSSNRPFACDAALVGGLILTAPVMLPYLMIEGAADRASRPALVQAGSVRQPDADAADPAPPWAAEPVLPTLADASTK